MEHVTQRYHTRDPIDQLRIAVTLRKASEQKQYRDALERRRIAHVPLGCVGFQQKW